MQQRVAINLFGQFELRLDGVPVRLPTRKVEAILALLAIEPDVALSRSTLAALLWPGQPDAQARSSLRQAIFRLKTALEPSDALVVTPGWIKLYGDRIARDIDALDRVDAVSALPLGQPLEGMSGFESEIEDRLDAARADLRARLMARLERAEAAALSGRRFSDLESLARRHLVLDGYDEHALRMLMTALWRQGRRNAALELFRETGRRIRADLSVSVDPSTTALYEEIRAEPPASEDRTQPAIATAPRAPTASPPDREADATLPHLRHVAVMHIVSDRLLAALRHRDPEDAEAASREASDAIERAVRREGGLVQGRAGHRLSCIFGVDRPDESPALSATFAAFEIARLDCAVGVDTSRALIGDDRGGSPAVHLAQTLAEAAASGDVLLTDRVAAACCGAFSFTAAAPLQSDGQAPVPVWQLVGEILSRGSFDIRKARGLTPFIGRERELDEVHALAAAAGPRAVAITGEAGIGKSRFVHEALTRLGPVHLLRVQFHSSEIGGGIARFASVLASLIGDRVADDPVTALDAVIPDPTLRRRIAPVEALFATRDDTGGTGEMPRSLHLQAIADALLLAVQLLAGRDAVLLIEDAHWADEDGATLAHRIVRSLDRDGPLVIVTLRPGADLNLSTVTGLRALTLAPLSEAESIRLLAHLGRDASGDITARSGGVPLFLEEIARLDPALDGEDRPVPETVASLLTRRIDALPPHLRRTIEAAAILGSEPADDLLQPLSGLRPDAYEAAIAELADGDLLYRIRSLPQRVYGFKHALVQEAAYQAIPTGRRKDLHARVVDLRHADWRAGDKTLSAMLAHHALESDQFAKAVELALCATEQAVARSSYPLANAMLAIALQSARALPPTPEHRRTEAQILAWQRPLHPLAHTETMWQNLKRSREIARDLGDDRLLVDACIHLSYYTSDNGRFPASLTYCDEAAAAADRIGDRTLQAEAAMVRARSYFAQGKFAATLAALEKVGSFWDDRTRERGDFVLTRYVFLRHLQTCCHAALGHAEMAVRRGRELVTAGQATGRPVDLFVAFLSLGEVLAAADRREDAMRIFARSAEVARDSELLHFVQWADTRSAELALQPPGLQTTEAEAEAQLLAAVRSEELSLFIRLSAEAALACHAFRDAPDVDPARLEALLPRVREVDLPAVELRILDTLARSDPDGTRGWAAAAGTIRAAQEYAPCILSDEDAMALLQATG
ncbi:AAA family ATPase [Roseobacter sp. HKCCA0434]|uniref:AAA family ATPase n=1 Tax=Roseobacter sp. HKCCA0434 TaxID=3079297 RepID=UPI002905BF3D|nr:AAA family ATPase [Roseobacter sp. HKCCA0434]